MHIAELSAIHHWDVIRCLAHVCEIIRKAFAYCQRAFRRRFSMFFSPIFQVYVQPLYYRRTGRVELLCTGMGATMFRPSGKWLVLMDRGEILNQLKSSPKLLGSYLRNNSIANNNKSHTQWNGWHYCKIVQILHYTTLYPDDGEENNKRMLAKVSTCPYAIYPLSLAFFSAKHTKCEVFGHSHHPTIQPPSRQASLRSSMSSYRTSAEC